MEELGTDNDKPRHADPEVTDILTSPISTHSNNNRNVKEIGSKQLKSNDDIPTTSDAGKDKSPLKENVTKTSSMKSNISKSVPSGPQIFVVRPLPSLASNTIQLQEGSTKIETLPYEDKVDFQSIKRGPMKDSPISFESTKTTHEDYMKCCIHHQNMQLELTKENEYLQIALSNATLELRSKDIEFQTRVAALNQNYGSSINDMKILLSSQRKLGNRWKEEMSALTQLFETTIRDLSTENREMKRMAEKLKTDLKDKSAEAKEAKEMNGIYSARLTKMGRQFKKLRDQDEESYIEMTF